MNVCLCCYHTWITNLIYWTLEKKYTWWKGVVRVLLVCVYSMLNNNAHYNSFINCKCTTHSHRYVNAALVDPQDICHVNRVMTGALTGEEQRLVWSLESSLISTLAFERSRWRKASELTENDTGQIKLQLQNHQIENKWLLLLLCRVQIIASCELF